MSYHLALGLTREPFSNSPDPDLLYRAKSHLECLQHMEIAVRLRRGLNVVLGEVGTGKTTLSRELVRILDADPDLEVHCLDDPYFATPEEFLLALCRLFGLVTERLGSDVGSLKDALKDELLARNAAGQRIVALLVDEGQKITPECLELLRELLNFETNTHKLLQIVMFAQTEFEDMLAARPNLDDRVNFRYRLLPLDRKQTRRMIETRLTLCAPDGVAPTVFTPLAMRRIHRLTGGYPRKIVQLCHHSMLLAVGYGKARVGWGMVGRAARQSAHGPGLWLRRTALAGGCAALLVFGYAGWTGRPLPDLCRDAWGLFGQGQVSVAALLQPSEADRAQPAAVAAMPAAHGAAGESAAPKAAPTAQPEIPAVTPPAVVPPRPAALALAEAPKSAASEAKARTAAILAQAAAPAPAQPVVSQAAAAAAAQVLPASADFPATSADRTGVVLPEAPIAAHAATTPAEAAAALAAPVAPAAKDRHTAPGEGLGAAMDLAAAALPPGTKESVIVVTTEDGLPALPQPAGQLTAPPVLPAAPTADKAVAAGSAASQGDAASLGEAAVKPGWALSRLAARVYGNGGRSVLAAIAKANPGVDMARLRAGESLVYPAIEAKAPPAGSVLVKVAAADSLEQGLALVARGKDRHHLTLALFCTRIPGAGPRFDVVLAALYPDQSRAQAALAALPSDLAAKAVLLDGFPVGTAYYTDLAEWRGTVQPKARPAVGRQVAESRPVAGTAQAFVPAPTAAADE